MFRYSLFLLALVACGDKDTGFGVPTETDTVNTDTSDTQDTDETGDTSVSGESDCANGDDDDGAVEHIPPVLEVRVARAEQAERDELEQHLGDEERREEDVEDGEPLLEGHVPVRGFYRERRLCGAVWREATL